MKPFKKQINLSNNEFRAISEGWHKLPDSIARKAFDRIPQNDPFSLWTHPDGICVSSAIHDDIYPDQSGKGKHYLIAISASPNLELNIEIINKVINDFKIPESIKKIKLRTTTQLWMPVNSEDSSIVHALADYQITPGPIVFYDSERT